MTKMASLTSSYTCRPTSAGTNPNMETLHCSGIGLCSGFQILHFYRKVKCHRLQNIIINRSIMKSVGFLAFGVYKEKLQSH